MITRRTLLKGAGNGAALAGSGLLAAARARSTPNAPSLDLSPLLPAGTRAQAALDSLPGKKPLIRLSSRPPNYETPLEYFRTAITPNDAFFVRYHLANIPDVDAKTWRLTIGGEGANGLVELDLDGLRALPQAEVVAVNQCSGNRRGLFQPHVPGVQWGYGAMGCARWKGARLKDILEKAGLKKEAIEVVFDGADEPVVDKTPDFIKSIPVWKALEETTLVAYEMNGEPLPHFNGFPARLVVPGWTGTYWMKHLTSIKAVTKPESGFWMSQAYRLPLGKFPVVSRFVSQETAVNTPITEVMVNSLITSVSSGGRLRISTPATIAGIAWDGGYGIQSVEVSVDGGESWRDAKLGEDLGRFAFRMFNYSFVPTAEGKHTVIARTTNKIGQTQPADLIQNPPGYNHNVMHSITLEVS
ncbi:MAG TPA: molybdopterin-dependent oxidoreductase [Methylocella sp.]|nr:molybdopterin-dependent oxidoreductase [Methylocella sp.]